MSSCVSVTTWRYSCLVGVSRSACHTTCGEDVMQLATAAGQKLDWPTHKGMAQLVNL